jgi:hypothetical protein
MSRAQTRPKERIDMHNPKRLGRFLALFATAGSLLFVSAAPAMATVHWSDTTHGIRAKGTVKVTENGSSLNCTASATQESSMSAGGAIIWSGPSGQLTFNCGSANPLGIFFFISAKSTSSVQFYLAEKHALDPFHQYYFQEPFTTEFVNGSGVTQSKLVFTGNRLGTSEFTGTWPITISGSLEITTASGGLLTLLP